MLLWLNDWVYGFAAVTMQGQPRPLCISSALAFQSFLTALFIFHIITGFHTSFGENSLRFLKKYGSLSLNKASTERRQCLYNPAHAATWKGTVIYFTSSTEGSLSIFHILHGYRQTFALHRSLPVAQFLFLFLVTGFAPCPKDMPAALRGGFSNTAIVTLLSPLLLPKGYMQWPAMKCFFSQVWKLAAHCYNSVCCRQYMDHMERKRVIRQLMYWFETLFMCFSKLRRAWEEGWKENPQTCWTLPLRVGIWEISATWLNIFVFEW